MTELLRSFLRAGRVRRIKRKIDRVGTGAYRPGGSSKPGHLYSPLPFPAFDDVPWQREACAERLALIRESMPNRFRGGRLLDIGCCTGFNCFKLCEDGFRCIGIDIDPDSIEIASDVARLYRVPVNFRTGEATLEVIDSLGRFDVVLFLSSFQWVTAARGYEYACALLKSVMRQSSVMFFETSMGAEGRAKMPMLPDADAVQSLLEETAVHTKVQRLGDVTAPNAWLKKSRALFRTES